MKVVILAGGLGTRISEESYLKPKPMITIGEQPILWHIMKYYSPAVGRCSDRYASNLTFPLDNNFRNMPLWRNRGIEEIDKQGKLYERRPRVEQGKSYLYENSRGGMTRVGDKQKGVSLICETPF